MHPFLLLMDNVFYGLFLVLVRNSELLGEENIFGGDGLCPY